jgi:hypothetical protein
MGFFSALLSVPVVS